MACRQFSPARTSKTPTCVYLANRGVRAANIPLVPGVPPPAELEASVRPLIVGLITDPERLVQIRVNRLRLLQKDTESEYTDMERVQSEIQDARRLYARRKWATIDVTRRSIEETSAAILQMLAVRREQRLKTLSDRASGISPRPERDHRLGKPPPGRPVLPRRSVVEHHAVTFDHS